VFQYEATGGCGLGEFGFEAELQLGVSNHLFGLSQVDFIQTFDNFPKMTYNSLFIVET
jgi:hypothetical protein